MGRYNYFDVVRFQGIEFVISHKRMVQRGRRAGLYEYQLAPLEPMKRSSSFGMKVWGESHLKKPQKKWTKKQKGKALEKYGETENDIQVGKEKRACDGREKIGEMNFSKEGYSFSNINIGDQILVNYRNGKKWEVVRKINYKTGKIGIDNPRYKQLQEAMDFDSSFGDGLIGLPGNRGPNSYRWILAKFVIQIKPLEK